MEQSEPRVSPQPREPWAQGIAVGKYALLAKIASGGMAEIWLARQGGPKGFEKVVVIKKIMDNLAEESEFIEMFLDEARIAAQLNHPNIVQIYDLGEAGGAFYIAMEYIPGENLATVVRAGNKDGRPMPVPYAVRLVANAAEGLAYAHSKVGLDGRHLQIVHRDISPHNLIVTYDGILKVVDFGIARAATRAVQTDGGQLKGKMAYMSPEQARGERYDSRSDIFSLGVVLFEMVTRTRLFAFDDSFQALAALTAKEPLPRARDRNPEVPQALDAIISRSLERKPQARYQTARNLQAALEDWLRKQEDAPGTVEVAGYMHGLFRERIEERELMLDSARWGDVTPSKLGHALRVPGKDVMPGATRATHALPSRRMGKLVATAAGLLVVAGVGYAVLRPVQSPPATVGSLLSVDTQPPGARVALDGVPRGNSPLTLDDVALGRHEIVATLQGHEAARTFVVLDAAGDKLRVVLALPSPARPPEQPRVPEPPKPPAPEVAREPAPKVAPAEPVSPPDKAVVPVPAPVLVAAPVPVPVPVAVPVPAAATREGSSPRAPRSPRDPLRKAMGKLALDVPGSWAEVFLAGKSLGDTPLMEVALPVGKHTLELVNSERAVKKQVEVEIEAGKTTVSKVKL